MKRHFGLVGPRTSCVARSVFSNAAWLCSAAVFVTGAAYAQSQPAVPGAVEEVVVTAQKRSEDVQKVPITVDALNAGQIRDRQIQTISDLSTAIPAIRTDDIAGMSNVTIRGVGTTFTTGAGESSVAVHIDGIYIPQPKAQLMGEDDLANIEVLRGPQGTLYGRNSTAGVINFITASPTDALEGDVSVRYGNYNDVRAQGYLSGPLSDSGDVRGRIYLTGEHSDGWGQNIQTGQKLDGVDSYGGRVGLAWDVKSWWTMELKVGGEREGFAGPVYQPYNINALVLGLAPPLFTTLKPGNVKSFQHYGSYSKLGTVSLKNEFELTDDISLTSLTGFVHFDSLYNFDGFAATVEPPFPGITTQLPPVTLSPFTQSNAFSQEFDLKGSTESLKWLVGLYYFHENQENKSSSNFDALGSTGFGLVPFPFYTNFDIQSSHRDSISGFVDGTYSLTSDFRVFAGGRLLNEKLTQDLTDIHAFGIAAPGDTPVTACSPATSPQSLDKSAITGRGGVEYDVTDNSMAYGQFSTGYKAGGFSQTQCGNEYKPETVNAGEIGYKSKWFDNKLTINLSGYHYDYRNLEIEQATIFGVPIVNAPRSHVLGLDVSVLGQVTDRLRFDGTATFMDARYDRFYNQDGTFGVPTCATPSNPASCPAGSSLAGIPLNKAPHSSGTIGANYLWPTPIGDLDFRAEMYMTSSYHLREYNLPFTIQNGYQLVNLYATLMIDDDRYEARAFAKNVTNKRYILGIDGIVTGAMGAYNPPMLFGVELSAKI